MKRAPNQPIDELLLFAGIYLRTWTVADAGTLLPQHAHTWDHISLIVRGAVRVWCDGELLGVFTAPATIKIAARSFHTFTTLADNTIIACIHAVGEADDVAVHEHAVLNVED
jgi:hypothetical protein